MIRILQQDNIVTKTIFALIIGATIVLMVIFLVPGIFDNGASNDATVYATVHSPNWWSKVTGDSTQVKMQDVQRMAQQQLKQQGLPAQFESFLLPRIEQQQVTVAVLKQEADRLHLQPTDADMISYLKNSQFGAVLFPEGNFVGYDKYVDFVQQYFQMPVTEFEGDVKKDIEIGRLEALITGGISVSDAAVRTEYLQEGTKVKFDYAVISLEDVKKGINPSDGDLQAWFKQNAARYAAAIPEQRKIQFFSFDSSSLPGGKPQVTDADIQTYYQQHLADYKTQDEIKTRHILISVPKGADAKTDAAAKAKAEDVLKQIKAGGNFADLAKKYSDDPGSKESGGELGMQPASMFVPEFSKAAMALNPGQTSDLVKSQFGYHIIQTEEKHAAGTKSLAEVKDQIATALATQKAGASMQAFSQQLVAEAKKNGLQQTAAAHHLQLETTDFIARTGSTIPSLPDASNVISSAFGAAKGAAPESASTGEGQAVFQVVDIKPAHAPEFDAFKTQILNDYRTDKAPALLNQQLTKLSDRAKVLNDLKKAADEAKIPVKTSDLVGRDAQVTDIGSLAGAGSVLFSLNKGGISGPINEGANGAIAQLVDKQEPTVDDIAKNLPATRDKMKAQAQNEAFGVFAGELFQKYEKAGAIVYSKKQAPPSPLGRTR